MKTLKAFLVIIAVLFLACLFTGCASMETKQQRCSAYSDAYAVYLATAEIRDVSQDEKRAAVTAAIFLRTYCGWTAPRGAPADTTDKNGVPVIYPPR